MWESAIRMFGSLDAYTRVVLPALEVATAVVAKVVTVEAVTVEEVTVEGC